MSHKPHFFNNSPYNSVGIIIGKIGEVSLKMDHFGSKFDIAEQLQKMVKGSC